MAILSVRSLLLALALIGGIEMALPMQAFAQSGREQRDQERDQNDGQDDSKRTMNGANVNLI